MAGSATLRLPKLKFYFIFRRQLQEPSTLCLYVREREREKEGGGGLKHVLLVGKNVTMQIPSNNTSSNLCSLWQQQH